jgi:hypothetical protein
MAKTELLAPYIVETYQKHTSPGFLKEPIFDYGISHYPPCLRSERTNRILLYPGSFNPPHHGHLELLHHVFARSGCDIVAAILIPLDDNRLIRKCRAVGEDLILFKKQRVELWRGKYWPHDWLWVYDRTEQEWEEFRCLLTNRTIDNGFDVSFILLCGPDYVRQHGLPPPLSWGCSDAITSDVSRVADFVLPTSLRTLKNCTPWEKISQEKDVVWRDVLEKTAWLCSGLSLLCCDPQMIHAMLEKGGCNLVLLRNASS